MKKRRRIWLTCALCNGRGEVEQRVRPARGLLAAVAFDLVHLVRYEIERVECPACDGHGRYPWRWLPRAVVRAVQRPFGLEVDRGA